MKKQILLTAFVAFALLFSGCRKKAPDLINPNEPGHLLSLPSQIFESFWHGMNNSYAFWDIDPTDWDTVYDEYLPKFRELDGLDEVPTETLKDLYIAMTKDIIDHHYVAVIQNPQAPEGDANQMVMYPGGEEAKRRSYYHANIPVETMRVPIEAYVADGRITEFKEADVGEGNGRLYVCSGLIDDNVVYFRFSQFMLTPHYEPDGDNPVSVAVDNYKKLLKETADLAGVIIDMRSNGGGYLADIYHVLSVLLEEDLHIGYSRNKEGSGRLDYGVWVPLVIPEDNLGRTIDVPVVAMADLQSVSMSELTSLAVSFMPNGCVIGERTFGGTGPLYGNYNFTYGGEFKNECIHVYSSTSMVKDVNGAILEGIGVMPDIEVLYDQEAMLAGRDVQLERTLQYIAAGS